jgi:hypothetical protein
VVANRSVIGAYLAGQLKEAIKMRIKHGNLLARFTAKFTPEVIERWTRMVEAWDQDHSQPNPYEEPENGMLLSDIIVLCLILD